MVVGSTPAEGTSILDTGTIQTRYLGWLPCSRSCGVSVAALEEELARTHGEPLVNLTQASHDTVLPSAPVQLVDWEPVATDAYGQAGRGPFHFLTTAQTRATQCERDRLLGGHRRAFRPFQLECYIPEPSS